MPSPEDVAFFSGGEQVSGWYYSASSEGRSPAVVLCAGFTGTKYAEFYQWYVGQLNSSGYHVLLFDYRGWGDSGGERGRIRPLWQVEDIRAALSFLELRSGVNREALGLFGVSFGAGNAVYTAAIDSRVKAVTAVSPVADGQLWLRQMRREYEWQDWLTMLADDRIRRATSGSSTWVSPTEEIMVSTPERRATTVKGNIPSGKTPNSTPLEDADAVLIYRPLDKVSEVAAPTLLIAADRDSVVPFEHSSAIFAGLSSPKRLVKVRSRSHYGLYTAHRDVISGEMLKWFDQYLTGAHVPEPGPDVRL